MAKLAVETEWFYDDVPFFKRKQYEAEYLRVYNEAAHYLNPFIDDLNQQFVEDIGEMDDYNNPLYNNWMAVHMTALLTKSGVIDSDIFRFVFYDSDIVLNCVTELGWSVRMELVPGSEEIWEEK